MKPDIKGLTKLATELRKVKPAQFAMGEWWVEGSCGTTGCIAGWAMKFFPHRFRKADGETYEDGTTDYTVEHRRSGHQGSQAFATGFRISEDDAEYITFSTRTNTPEAAAKAIMVLVGKLRKKVKA
jgi:hypothetical protein